MNEDLRRYIEKLKSPPWTKPLEFSLVGLFAKALEALMLHAHAVHGGATDVADRLIEEGLMSLRKHLEEARRLCLHPKARKLEEDYRQVAKETKTCAGELELDDDDAVGLTEEDNGAWVRAWIWVSKDELEAQEEKWAAENGSG